MENKEEMIEKAARMANSKRGQYIISQALCIAIEELEKVPAEIREYSNIADMKYLRDTLFPIFSAVKDAENMIKEVNEKLNIS